MTNRLAPFMDRIVDKTQAAFFKRIFILDNVLAANELIHSAKKV
jgi:hypothetical protein